MKKNKSLLGFGSALLLVSLVGVAQAQPPHGPAVKMTTEEALKQAPKQDPGLVPIEKAADSAQAQLKKRPKDPAAKRTYVDAAYKYGHAIMYDRGKMSPAIQYRAALAMYRKA